MSTRHSVGSLLVVFTVSACFAQGAEIAISTFDANREGWTVIGDAPVIPDWVPNDGNPGGYIETNDEVAGGVWYWKAPAQFLGDVSAAFGGVLSFDLRQSDTSEPFDSEDVMLSGGGTVIVLDHSHPGSEWTSYVVPLDSSANWRLNHENGPMATDQDILAVLGNLESLRIRGEYRVGEDTGGLDNVILTPCPVGGTDGLLLFRESNNPSWECLNSGEVCIAGWDHSALLFNGLVYESHPVYASGEYWDPIESTYVSITADVGVQAQHTLGSFQHDSQEQQSSTDNNQISIPASLACEMVDFIQTQMDAGFVFLCPTPFDFDCLQEFLAVDLQKGLVDSTYTCVGLLERSAEEAGHNEGQGFIPDAWEVLNLPGIGELPLLSPELLYYALIISDAIEIFEKNLHRLAALFDPVDFILTDPLGRRLGYTDTLGLVNEIPGAFYAGDGDMEQFLIVAPIPGIYVLELFGIGVDVEAAVGGSMPGEAFKGFLDNGEVHILKIEVPTCLGDLNGDGVVGPFDLALVLGNWGPNPGHPADFDGDGDVGAADLAVLLGNWGPCEP